MAARRDRFTAVVLLVFAGYTIVSAWRLGYWQGRIPGPGFAPIWVGAGLALAAVVMLLRNLASRGPAAEVPPGDRRAGRREARLAVEIVATTVVTVLLVPWVGLITAVGLLLLALVKLLGGPWRTAVATAVLLPAVFYVLFVRWLQVPVPTGPWGF